MTNPNNLQEFKPEQFGKDVQLEEGMVISFSDAKNTELPGVVKEVHPDRVVVDFNHPLAGRVLTFEAEILDVTPV